MTAFWPGPLTLLLPRTAAVPDAVTAGRPLVGVRMPRHPVALELIRRAGVPVAAPSANRFGRTSPTTAAHVLEDLDGRIDAVLDGGATTVGVESTVLDVGAMMIYRPGSSDGGDDRGGRGGRAGVSSEVRLRLVERSGKPAFAGSWAAALCSAGEAGSGGGADEGLWRLVDGYREVRSAWPKALGVMLPGWMGRFEVLIADLASGALGAITMMLARRLFAGLRALDESWGCGHYLPFAGGRWDWSGLAGSVEEGCSSEVRKSLTSGRRWLAGRRRRQARGCGGGCGAFRSAPGRDPGRPARSSGRRAIVRSGRVRGEGRCCGGVRGCRTGGGGCLPAGGTACGGARQVFCWPSAPAR